MTPFRPKHFDAPVNLLLLGGLWIVYATVKSLTQDTKRVALANAARLVDVQSALGLDIERTLQSAIDWPQAFIAANTYYLLHFPLTIAILTVTFLLHRNSVYPVLRNALIGSTATGLVLHLLMPMAPPRMLPGFIDATILYGPDPYSIPGSASANQFAAMPSMHVGWAILIAYAVWKISEHPIVRGVAALHPILTGLTVIITGHHFVADIAIGGSLAVGFLALAIATARATAPKTPAPPRPVAPKSLV